MGHNFHKYIFICFLLTCFFTSNGQTRRIDSLKQFVYNAKTDQQKLAALISLCDEYKSLNKDTLDHYAVEAKVLADKSNSDIFKSKSALAMAYSYMRWGWRDSVLLLTEQIINENKDRPDHDLYFKASRLNAMSQASKSHYQEALTVFYTIIKEAELYKDTLVLGENLNTIGSISLIRDQPKEALVWLSRALAVSTNDYRYKPISAAVYVNMAEAYSKLNKKDSAVILIEKGINLFRETQNLSSLAIALQKQSAIYIALGKFDKAEAALKEMIRIRAESGDSDMYIDDNISLAEFYIQTNQIDKAIAFCNARLITGDIHKSNSDSSKVFSNNISIRLEYYKILARCYKIKGDNQSYQQALEQIIAAKDSFHTYNSEEAIAEMQTQYEVQKQENTIIKQKLDITKKNNLFYSSAAIAIFIGLILLILFIDYRKREKLKLKLILEKEKDLAAMSVAKAEENERKRIAADLHDNLGVYAASIVSNLDHLSLYKQEKNMAKPLMELRNNSQAIITQLSDTIWALKKEALSLTAISDRLKVFIQRVQPSYPDIVIDVIEDISEDHLIPALQAFHLFQILQEAINNSLRHSRCKHISIQIKGNTDWSVSVTDDGIGIADTILNEPTGNGILNMKHRAETQGWTIVWQNNMNGTVVTVSHTTN